ncbi:MAG TPA: hypothetical protein VLA34_11025, partial [Candidatus Krumholzibacterium sp.]|nr:hypothetical protein [Candidatus Krumholzibacterium sp.]
MSSILSFSASGMMLLSGITAALRGRYNPQRIFYILSTLAASAIMLSQGFVLRSHSPGQTLGEFQILLSVCIFFPAAALPFFALFARDDSTGEFRRMLPGIIVLAVLLGSAAILVPVQMIVREITFTEAMVLWRITFTGL